MKKLVAVVICSIFIMSMVPVAAAVSFTRGQVLETAKNPSELIRIRIDFPTPEITAVNEYYLVTMEGLDIAGDAGEPLLPFRTVSVLVPFGREVKEVRVVLGKKVTLSGSYILEPGQECFPIGIVDESTVGPTPPNDRIYSSLSPFPAEISSDESIQSKMGCKILFLNIHPVSYVPATGEISYFKSVTVEVETSPCSTTGDELPARRSPNVEKIVEGIVDNPEALGTYFEEAPRGGTGLLDSENYQYVIITNQQLRDSSVADNWGALMAQKNSRGITTNLVTTEWIYANYDGTRPDGGTDNQTKIRNFIIDAYTNWGTEYVLLGGYSGIISPRMFYADGTSMPSDLYYACLDGTFDDDANGTYGEPHDGPGGGEVDLLAEVYVGRACVANEQELSNFVRKTIAYETQNSNDLRHAYMLGEYLGFGGISDYATESMEEIRLGSNAHGYHTEGFAFTNFFEVGTLYDAPGYSWPKSDLIDIIDNDVHILNHLGHASYQYDMKLNNADLDTLTNDEYFFGYSQGCNPGAFDTTECFAEHATTIEHGAFAFVANARFGWGMGSSTDGPSQRYDRMFWNKVFGEGMLNIGKVNQESKENLSGRINEQCMRWCYYETNLFGDPETPFQTICDEGVVSTNKKFYQTSDTVNVTVRDFNLDLNPGVPDTTTVEISSIKENTPENITLTETGPSTKTFVGSIDLDNGGSPTPDGKLQVFNEDIITATYHDENDGSGNPAVSICTAIADGVAPPTPVLLYPPDGASVSDITTDFGWTKVEDYSGVVTYTFQVDNESSFTDPIERSGLVDNSYELDVTLTNGNYYWRVRAVDGAGNPSEWSEVRQFTLEINTHEPILIQGNNEFDAAHGVTGGSGSAEDPYIIENWAIRASTAHGIHIKNTNAYFVIRNCQVIGGQDQYNGIYLENVQNGRIESAITEEIYYGTGIYLSNSSNNTLIGNNAPSGLFGIYLSNSSNNDLTGNTALNDVAIVLDGSKNNTLTGNTASSGAFDNPSIGLYNSDNNTLTYNTVSSSDYGFYLQDSDNTNLAHNIVSNNGDGIFSYGSNNTAINYNAVSNNTGLGISVDFSSNSILTGNTVSNGYYGIYFEYTSNNTLTGNSMLGNEVNFSIRGNSLSHYIQNIDTSNTVDGKPIYYWVNQQDRQIPSDAGFVGIVNSDNITVSGLTLTNNLTGVLLVYSTNSRIENIIANNNANGINLFSSNHNTLTGNNTSNNSIGISLDNSNYNNVTANTSSNNISGIGLYNSSNNELTGNTAENNSYYGITVTLSTGNTIKNNTVLNSYYGIKFLYSSNNLIYNNYFSNAHNVYSADNNTWNIEKTAGTNILGGPYLGGNYWSDYTGVDNNGDGLGDTLLPYNANGGIAKGGDYHPLVPPDNTIPPAPALISPLNGALVNDSTPTFRWTSVTAPAGVTYKLQYSTDNSFQTATTIENLLDNTYTVPDNMALVDNGYYWRVRAVDGAGNQGNWSDIWCFTVDATPPAAPSLISPANGENLNNTTPMLSWNAVSDVSLPVLYRALVDNDSNFSSPEVDSGWIASTSFTTSALTERVYYWKVQAKDNAGNVGGYSSVWSFRVDVTAPSAPSLVSPANGANLNSTTPTLNWNIVSDVSVPVVYRALVDNDSNFSSPEADSGWIVSTTFTTPALTERVYYWKVQAKDNAGNVGVYSSSRSFRIDVTAPSAPSLVSPANGATINDNTPTFRWAAVTDPSGVAYKLQYSTDNTFQTATTIENLLDNTYTVPDNMALVDNKYYWRVRAIDGAGNQGDWSSTWQFTVQKPAPRVWVQTRWSGIQTYPTQQVGKWDNMYDNWYRHENVTPRSGDILGPKPGNGYLESSVYDAGLIVSWTKVEFDTTGGGTVKVYLRFDNDSDPSDKQWVQRANGATFNVQARYAQYKVELTGTRTQQKTFTEIRVRYTG